MGHFRVGSTTELPAEIRQTTIHLPHHFQGDGKRFHQSREGGMSLFSWPGDGGDESRVHDEYLLLLGKKNEKQIQIFGKVHIRCLVDINPVSN
jgi:hypothetical protein